MSRWVLAWICRQCAKLGVLWSSALSETTSPCYEGKPNVQQGNLCLSSQRAKRNKSFSPKNSIQGSSVLDCVDMVENGLACLPPNLLAVAFHLHPGLKSITAGGPSLPSKAGIFKFCMREKCYQSFTIAVKALNVSSMLMVYQAELEEDMTCFRNYLSLHLHCFTVQASGRAFGIILAQEKALRLNLSSLSQGERPTAGCSRGSSELVWSCRRFHATAL